MRGRMIAMYRTTTLARQRGNPPLPAALVAAGGEGSTFDDGEEVPSLFNLIARTASCTTLTLVSREACERAVRAMGIPAAGGAREMPGVNQPSQSDRSLLSRLFLIGRHTLWGRSGHARMCMRV